MIYLVNDANILIDLLKTDLLDTFFQSEYDFHVTDLVLNEVEEKNLEDLLAFIDRHHLSLHRFSFEELLQIQSIKDRFGGLSIPDCSCLILSLKLQATLLTGDAALRWKRGQVRFWLIWKLCYTVNYVETFTNRISWSMVSCDESRQEE